MANPDPDPLLLLRQSIATGSAIVPTASPDTSASAPPEEAALSQATHLLFSSPTRLAVPIHARTRFVSNDKEVDLRSIYFAWLNREVAIPEYNASATKLNEDLAGEATVHKFAFVERLDLITWLEGASEESDYIKPLAGDKAGAAAGAATAAASKAAPVLSRAGAGRGTLDPRLQQIYDGERRMGDRNTVLRGIKPTDFSHVRKLAHPFMKDKSAATPGLNNDATLVLGQKQRRPDPIIMLSPSASSILRMSNAKSFLDGGKYTPPDHHASSASMLHITRPMKEIDPSGRPMRFILVEGPEQFKAEYWNRVVAVFTTGQAWQFKNYKWSKPDELFRHVLGIYLGWRGDAVPDPVKGYGHRVVTFGVAPTAETNRWQDRQVVESIWKVIETNMRMKGWRKDAAPPSI